jgi:hypothetical protein
MGCNAGIRTEEEMHREAYIQGYINKTAAVSLDIEIGDVILSGRYKNKRKVVTDLGTDELGQPTVNGMKLLAVRIEKKLPKSKWSSKSLEEVSNEKEAKSVTIVKGNPKYVEGNKDADKFYAAIQTLLEEKGYRVAQDPGAEYTSPPEDDYAWIGHSRGVDRLRFAPKGMRTIGLGAPEFKDAINHPDDMPEVGKEPTLAHYTLTDDMKRQILERLA